MEIETKKLLRTRLLKYSIDNNLSHIPSALSMYNYLYELFENHESDEIINPYTWNIVIGKPFGAQSYYVIWHYFYMLDKTNLGYGVKHSEIDFVDYGEETLGNALGIASGICYNGKRTWCNISDGALQMGPTLEAIQFIGHNKQDIVLTVDYNRTQLTGNTTSIMGMTINGVYEMFYNAGWKVYIIESNNFLKGPAKALIEQLKGPIVFLIETTKGDGVVEMENDPVTWHYKQLKDINEITLSR